MSFLKKIFTELFVSTEKKYVEALNEEISLNNYVNLRKIPTKLSIEQRVALALKLKTDGKLNGIYVPKKVYFFSMGEKEQKEFRDLIKSKGKIELAPLKQIWNVQNSLLFSLLQHFEDGLISNDFFYTKNFLNNFIKKELQSSEEYELSKLKGKLDIEQDDLFKLIRKLIQEKTLEGVIQDNSRYLDKDTFNELMLNYIEEKMEDSPEIEYDDISKELKISIQHIEGFLIQFAKENPDLVVVYPIEKKLRFKG